MPRNVLLLIAILSAGCASQPVQPTPAASSRPAHPEGRCEVDADCLAGERCNTAVATACEQPPFCGVCTGGK